MQKTKDDHKGAHRRRSHPRVRIPEHPIHTNGCWGPGVGSCAGTLPSHPKGIPDVRCGGRRVYPHHPDRDGVRGRSCPDRDSYEGPAARQGRQG